jgi:hypothetical protein
LIQAFLLFILCLGILLPVFMPKYRKRSVIEQEAALRIASQGRPDVLSTNVSFLGDESEYKKEFARDVPIARKISPNFGAVDEVFRGALPTVVENSMSNSSLTPREFGISEGLSPGFGPHSSINGMSSTAMLVHAEVISDEGQASGPVGTSLVSRSETYFTQLATKQRLRRSGAR